MIFFVSLTADRAQRPQQGTRTDRSTNRGGALEGSSSGDLPGPRDEEARHHGDFGESEEDMEFFSGPNQERTCAI